jgi:hypothetical protein
LDPIFHSISDYAKSSSGTLKPFKVIRLALEPSRIKIRIC